MFAHNLPDNVSKMKIVYIALALNILGMTIKSILQPFGLPKNRLTFFKEFYLFDISIIDKSFIYL